jgi:hypothetical protein
MSTQKTIHIQGEMREDTLHKVDDLKKRLGSSSRMSAVASSVYIADFVTKIINKGGQVILEDRDGRKSLLDVSVFYAS